MRISSKLYVVVALLVLGASCLLPQRAGGMVYTEERRLVYEDVSDLPPYSFRNEKGEPDGFNVDLVKMLLNELHIPFTIKMTNVQEAYNDLKSGKSDLIMGLSAGFHDQYGHYSTNSVTLFTQSIVSPASNPSTVRNFNDLRNHRVVVNDGSLCHHLMIDHGWGNNAIPTRDVVATLLKMSTDEEGEMVWNTLSLKWLLQKYHIDNLTLQPMNMPHGEYKFMSNDDELLAKLDSVYTVLHSADRITPLHNKWFYPERQEQSMPQWGWYVVGGVVLLILIMIIYTLSYRLEAHRIAADNNKRNRRLALILETSGVRVWTYDIATRLFTWRNEFGQPAFVYTEAEFAQRYDADDFARLSQAIERLSRQEARPDAEEEEITLDIKAQDAREDGDTEKHDFIIALSVLRRDKKGMPSILIGTKKDVTKKRRLEREADERTLRYWALFNTPIVGIVFYDRDGHLLNINQKACDMFGCSRDEILERHPMLSCMFGVDLPPAQTDGFHATLIAPQMPEKCQVMARRLAARLYIEYRLMTVNDEAGELLGVFAFCTDVSYVAKSREEESESESLLASLQAKEREYVETIDDFLRNGDSRVVSYSPQSHVLTINRTSEQVQHRLTPTRLMTLVDDRMRIKAMHIINNMDARVNAPVDTDMRTTLRRRDGKMLHLYLHLLPQLDAEGTVVEYLGILRDISELKATELQLARTEAKAREVEDTKTAFIKNMMQEIRTPMSKVIQKAGLLSADGEPVAQQAIRHDIVGNAELLTHIINNVLYLSRLEAHMVEIVRQPTDFALIFEEACRTGWEKDLSPHVKCVVNNPYDQLVLDIDPQHLGNVIAQLTRNAAQHTTSGVIHTRYDYIGRRLIISIDDTGDGIAPADLQRLNGEYVSGIHTSSGMGLPICKELLRQMGGHLELSSELGLGTTVWVTLPCQATVVKRKMIV